jgi:hypothetical protein
MLGRGLRLSEGQTECLVLDLAGATEDHSLVAAPALIGGSRCKVSPTGQHDFVDLSGRAACRHEGCSVRLACWAGLQAGGTGAHTWDDGAVRRCVHCRHPQCKPADDGRHLWVPQPGWVRQCANCEATSPMPLASLQDGRGGPREPAPEAAWSALHQVAGPGGSTVEVLDLGDHGLLYLVSAGELATPVWLPPRARNPRPMAEAPVERWYALELAADLVRKARKAWDPWRREVVHGGTDGTVDDVADLRRRAAVRAVSTGVASWR